jgi:hypothetical protein
LVVESRPSVDHHVATLNITGIDAEGDTRVPLKIRKLDAVLGDREVDLLAVPEEPDRRELGGAILPESSDDCIQVAFEQGRSFFGK